MYRIFVIEDDPTIRNELTLILEQYGYLPLTTDHFENLAARVLSEQPHLLLLDINLPVLDGYQLCRQFRKQSEIPIIIVTSRDSELDELMSMNLGADDFITKPYNTQILAARIAALLHRTYQLAEDKPLIFRDISLDTSKYCVSRLGKSTELTRNEFRILRLLMEKSGKIVSRDEIMNALWQSNEFIDDNTLTVNIGRLRQKLRELGAEDYLKTKRGQGYLL